MLKLPRFTSLLVKRDNRRQYWKATRVNIDQHLIVIRHNASVDEEEAEDAINGYLAELASALPMSTEKPLWEIHVLLDLRCLVLRIHHAIGDATSLASLITEIGSSGIEKVRRAPVKGRASNVGGGGVSAFFQRTWLSTVFVVDFLVKYFLVGDKETVLHGKNSYVNNWPQKLATARFNLLNVILVKKAIPNATINDVMCGIIWGGFLKYINSQSSTALKEGQQITGMVMANMRPRLGLLEVSKLLEENSLELWWGNKFGMFLLPLYYTKNLENPLEWVRKVKLILDRKKQSVETRFIVNLRNLVLRLCGVKVLSCLGIRGWSNMTFGLSNVVGPPEKISIAGNPVKFLNFSLSSSPLGILMSLMSYNNILELQILAAEDVIPDPKILASCFKDTLQEMKHVVNQPGFQPSKND